eukprot:gene4241-5361_t
MNGDLGMVEYVFSDKTGTLTENLMRFCRCSVGGVVYGDSPSVSDMPVMEPSDVGPKKGNVGGVGGGNVSGPGGSGGPQAPTSRSRGAPLQLLLEAADDPRSQLTQFVLAMALCHTVVVDPETGGLQSESPDEEALVKAASDLGWAFRSRSNEVMVLECTKGRLDDDGLSEASGRGVGGETSVQRIIQGRILEYELLATIPFDSTRKRMSVVLRGPDKKVFLLCKGADNIIFERSVAFMGVTDRTVLDAHLDTFASDGLRTLVVARRELSDEQYSAFAARWHEASTSLSRRAELYQEAAATVESQLTVLGMTGVEDKLQVGVPETLADLGYAGVKVWVLTGDKVETAVNIGYSSRLLGPQMLIIKLTDRGESAGALKRRLRQLINHLHRIVRDEALVTRIWNRLQRTIRSAISRKTDDSSDLSSVSEDELHDVRADMGMAGKEGGSEKGKDKSDIENATTSINTNDKNHWEMSDREGRPVASATG